MRFGCVLLGTVALAWASCGGGETSLRVTLTGEVDPSTVRVSLWDEYGQLLRDHALPASPAALPGDLVILVADGAKVRIEAAAMRAQARANGIGRAVAEAHQQTDVALALATPAGAIATATA